MFSFSLPYLSVPVPASAEIRKVGWSGSISPRKSIEIIESIDDARTFSNLSLHPMLVLRELYSVFSASPSH